MCWTIYVVNLFSFFFESVVITVNRLRALKSNGTVAIRRFSSVVSRLESVAERRL